MNHRARALCAATLAAALAPPVRAGATDPTAPGEGAASLTALVPAPASSVTPSVVTLEAPPDATELEVLVRAASTRALGRVPLAPGGAFRGAIRSRNAPEPEVYVAAQQSIGRNAATYQTALFRVTAQGVARLADGLTDASSPLVTERGTVLVQRGSDGAEPELAGQALRERTDALRIDAVDSATHALRTVWSGQGQLAYLATALRDDEALVYHLTDAGAFLVRIDAARSTARTVAGPIAPLARDFSYDRARDEVHYARAVPNDASGAYELVAQPLSGAPARVTLRAASDRLMPRALCSRALAYSAPRVGLALIPLGAQQISPRIAAPFGEGTDAVLAHTDDCAWVAVRHMTLAPAVTERHALYAPATGQRVSLSTAPDRAIELVGLVGGRAR